MRSFGSTILAILAVTIGIPVLIVWGVRTSVLEAAPWRDALQQARVYDRALTELLPELTRNLQSGEGASSGIPLSADDLAAIIRSAVSPALLQEQVEKIVVTTFDVVHGRVAVADITLTIPLQDVKRRLPTALHDRLVEKLRALPVCTSSTLAEYQKQKDLDGILPPCIPKGTNVRALVETAYPAAEIVKDLPDTLDIATKLREQGGNATDSYLTVAERAQAGVTLGFQVHLALTVFWVLLALGTGAVHLPNIRRGVRWVGGTIIITALLVTFGATALRRAPERFLPKDTTAVTAQDIFAPVVQAMAGKLAARAQLLGLIVAGVGVVTFSIGFALPRKRVDSEKKSV